VRSPAFDTARATATRMSARHQRTCQQAQCGATESRRVSHPLAGFCTHRGVEEGSHALVKAAQNGARNPPPHDSGLLVCSVRACETARTDEAAATLQHHYDQSCALQSLEPPWSFIAELS